VTLAPAKAVRTVFRPVAPRDVELGEKEGIIEVSFGVRFLVPDESEGVNETE
jgi:hypothetical protein